MSLKVWILEREWEELKRFAFFDPRFREVCGSKGRLFILGMIVSVTLGLGYWWRDQDLEWAMLTRPIVWCFLFLTGCGVLFVGNFLGEVLLKSWTVLRAIPREPISFRWETKVCSGLFAALWLFGLVALAVSIDGDLYAYPAWATSGFVLYAMIRYAWEDWYSSEQG